MVEEVLEVCAKLEAGTLVDVKPFQNAQINVVNRRHLHVVTTSVRESAELGNNELGIRVVCQVSNKEWTRRGAAARGSRRKRTGAKRRNIAAGTGYAFGIEDSAVARCIAVQIAINAALNVAPLT